LFFSRRKGCRIAEDFSDDLVKEILSDIKKTPNPTLVVSAAIEKASIFLDLIHSEIENDEMSPRYLEVASQLITTIIQSSSFLSANDQSDFDNKLKKIGSKQKDRELDIKEKDMEIKQLMYNKKGGGGNNNILVTDHASIMKYLTEASEKECTEIKEVTTTEKE
jgi:hypothetical protein